ncbi:4-hydroxythreonine-4-phosphate dehydrogenase PdxA [Sphingosinicella sp.]|uniref:4-hydroxythreonine-4-phosphate dehydrogenase PdxA n=1 Tax=Sphingosinicella sp. TaxID=1917971 RepID=UPI001824293D|nr:4-hydroxythreonine-4-phosphate dehydrogenase PdxA [Sphingosinicella sp.]MBA4757367.1 4-hydroxythreonine-4-phosphate dehydrogenase PdxA [Sphingosinicella sp.]
MIPPIAVTLGDPAGIGPEIIGRCWEQREALGLPPFFGVGNRDSLAGVWKGPVCQIEHPDDVGTCCDALPLIEVADSEVVEPGKPTLIGARCALDALEIATGLTRSGAAGALATGPVSKAQLQAIGFTHPGQTEFVGERCGVFAANLAMMLVGPTLRTVPVTIHVALADVPQRLTTDLIVSRGRAAAKGLTRNFGIQNPRIAVAGLNPHAGESGLLGREEIDVIAPAIAELQAEGIDAFGPLSADAMFHEHARKTYDAALCMYHDQALVPLKTLHFDEGVNLTLGLPIVRTAPDHGTAFDIAGKGIASHRAMAAAIKTAHACAVHRAID